MIEEEEEIKQKRQELDKGFKKRVKNDYNVEWDIFIKGASEGWLKKMKTYNNVYNTVDNFYEMLVRMDYKVSYGYFKINDKKYMRSCYLVKDEKVVDTNRHFYKNLTDMEYISYVDLDIRDYVRLVSQEDGDITLANYFKKREGRFIRYAVRNSIYHIK